MSINLFETCKGCTMASSGCFIQTYTLDIKNCPCSICLVKTMCMEAREHVGCQDRVKHILDSNRAKNNIDVYIHKAAKNLIHGITYLQSVKRDMDLQSVKRKRMQNGKDDNTKE